MRGPAGPWSTTPNQDGCATRSEVQSHLSAQTVLTKGADSGRRPSRAQRGERPRPEGPMKSEKEFPIPEMTGGKPGFPIKDVGNDRFFSQGPDVPLQALARPIGPSKNEPHTEECGALQRKRFFYLKEARGARNGL